MLFLSIGSVNTTFRFCYLVCGCTVIISRITCKITIKTNMKKNRDKILDRDTARKRDCDMIFFPYLPPLPGRVTAMFAHRNPPRFVLLHFLIIITIIILEYDIIGNAFSKPFKESKKFLKKKLELYSSQCMCGDMSRFEPFSPYFSYIYFLESIK